MTETNDTRHAEYLSKVFDEWDSSQIVFDQRERRPLQGLVGSEPLDRQDVVTFAEEFAGDDPSVTIYPTALPEQVTSDGQLRAGTHILGFWIETGDAWWYFDYNPYTRTDPRRWYMYDGIEKGTPDATLVEWRIDDEDYPSERIVGDDND